VARISARFDFDSKHLAVLVRYDEIYFPLQLVSIMVYFIVLFLRVGNGAQLMVNPSLHQFPRKIRVYVRLILLPVKAVGDKAGICGEELRSLADAVVVRFVPCRHLVEHIEGAHGVDVVVRCRLAHARRRAEILYGKQL